MAYLLIGLGFSYDVTYQEMMFQPCCACLDCACGDHTYCVMGKNELTAINVMYFAEESPVLSAIANLIKDIQSGEKTRQDAQTAAHCVNGWRET